MVNNPLSYTITVSNGTYQSTYENCHRPRIKKNVLSFWCYEEEGVAIPTYEFYIGNPGCSVKIQSIMSEEVE